MKNNSIQSIPYTAPLKGRSIQTLLASVSISRLRTTVQGCFTLFCIFVGYRFYCFYLWALDRSETYVSRPPSVEAFLPISALLGLKRLALTGQWDPVHPAGLTIFVAALAIAFLFRKGFCGWICPAGFVSNLLEKTGKPFRFSNHLPAWLDCVFLCLKYLLLAFFIYIILLRMDLRSVEAFLHSPYNLVADAKMLVFFLQPSTLTIAVLGFLVLISFLMCGSMPARGLPVTDCAREKTDADLYYARCNCRSLRSFLYSSRLQRPLAITDPVGCGKAAVSGCRNIRASIISNAVFGDEG
jgi:hypothetical protein